MTEAWRPVSGLHASCQSLYRALQGSVPPNTRAPTSLGFRVRRTQELRFADGHDSLRCVGPLSARSAAFRHKYQTRNPCALRAWDSECVERRSSASPTDTTPFGASVPCRRGAPLFDISIRHEIPALCELGISVFYLIHGYVARRKPWFMAKMAKNPMARTRWSTERNPL